MVLGVIGADASGTLLDAAMDIDGCGSEFMVRDVHTTSKTRFVAGGKQLLRVDMEGMAKPLSREEQTELMARLFKVAEFAQAIVISDYAKGAVTPAIASGLICYGNERGIPVIVDTKQPLAKHYRGATVIKPNLKEAAEAQRRPIPTTVHDARPYAGVIWLRAKAQYVLMTMGSMGMALASAGDEVLHVPAHPVKEIDVTGAGDTVAAALALALARGEDILEAARFANAAAAVVVTKSGTARPSLAEIRFFHDPDLGRDRTSRRTVAGQGAESRLH